MFPPKTLVYHFLSGLLLETCCSDFHVLTKLTSLFAASNVSVPFKNKIVATGTSTCKWGEQSLPLILACAGAYMNGM